MQEGSKWLWVRNTS